MRGEVWSFAEPGGGSRTLLVLQARAITEAAPTVVGAVVSHRPQRAGEPLTVALPPVDAAGDGPAWVKTTQLHTVAIDDAHRRLSTLPAETMRRVEVALAEVLGLP